MAEQLAASPATSSTWYLRLPADAGSHDWIRRSVFASDCAWRRTHLFECASSFPTREAAVAFARDFRVARDVQLVTVTTEAIDAE